MSNYYIKFDSTSSNATILNTINVTGLASKNPVDYKNVYYSQYLHFPYESSEVVDVRDDIITPSYTSRTTKEMLKISTLQEFSLIEITPTLFEENEATLESLDGYELFTDSIDFTTAYPYTNTMEITRTEQTQIFS